MKKLIALWAAFVLFLPGCTGSQPQKRQTEFFGLFDTYIAFACYTDSEEEFQRYAGIVQNELQRLHRLFDIYSEYPGLNNLKTINDNAGRAPVPVEPELIRFLEYAVDAGRETEGAVNIAMGTVLRLWHDLREAAEANPERAAVPSRAQLIEASAHMDPNNLVIDSEQCTVFFADPEMSLDVGAIAKGYAVQAAMDKAREAGLVSGLLNAGGNIRAEGRPLDGRNAWSIGVEGPVSGPDGTEIISTLSLTDCSAATSGDYQRFYTVDGKAYHHIIDPDTLYPADHVRSVTVIHPDAGIADLLSTAAFVMPYEDARAFVEHKGGEAIWTFADGSFARTDGYDTYVQR